LLILGACTPVKPVTKIGLLAPFEGLHRRSGYEALAALRLALADYEAQPGAPDLAVLPLALDDSRDPARAAQKLLVDRGVHAIVGPLTPATAATVAAELADSPAPAALPWFLPFAVDPSGLPAGTFGTWPTDPGWATELVAAVAAEARSQGAQTLVLAGAPAGWPALTDAAWAESAGMPVRQVDDASPQEAGIQAAEAIFWLGDAEAAAGFLAALRTLQPAVPFWLGPQGGDPVFAERATGALDNAYWATWSNVEYNRWAAQHSPSTPSAYLVYLATQQALATIAGTAPQPAPPWQVATYEFQPDGTSRRFSSAP
jgi:branched-chain amino acid transport system substrate-binding protein